MAHTYNIQFYSPNIIESMVIDNRGESGFTKLLFDDVASKLVNYAPCIVLVVK
jgi:nucleotide-binding universal stress UspA family protein